MDDRARFVQRFVRLQVLLGVFLLTNIAAAMSNPELLIVVWAVGFPIGLVFIWRLRCWKCARGLAVSNVMGEIEWRRIWLWWVPSRHKTCGAELI
jgi:hypothetical protein